MESVKGFFDLGLHDWISTQCKTVGLKQPTPIQTACIPQILNGTLLQCAVSDNIGFNRFVISNQTVFRCIFSFLLSHELFPNNNIIKTHNGNMIVHRMVSVVQ